VKGVWQRCVFGVLSPAAAIVICSCFDSLHVFPKDQVHEALEHLEEI